jgi:hypothetical protein
MPGVGLVPTLPFLLKVAAGILAKTSDRGVMGSWFLKNNHPVSTHNNEQFVAGLDTQGFAGFARDYDLVLARESG